MNKTKKELKKNIKALFLILNIIIATISFSYLINSADLNGLNPGREGGPLNPQFGVHNLGNPPSISNVPTSGLVEEISAPFDPYAVVPKPSFYDLYLNTPTAVYNSLMILGIGIAIGAIIGHFTKAKRGEVIGGISGGAGALAYMIATFYAEKFLTQALIGVGVGTFLFLVLYKEESKEIVEFICKPFEAPIGGQYCEECNNYKECSEYTCKSLGQACAIVNEGGENQKCIWKNPRDVTSPRIKIVNVTKDHKFVPDTAIRPPATGVVISKTNGNCIEAFTPLEFTIETDEPSQCKIDYNLTSNLKTAFDDMSYYVAGSNIFSYDHTEKLSLPGPDNINRIAPEIKNDGTYTLYIRCRDANGNFNVDAFSVRFCVNKGPDTTPPRIESTSISSGSPVQFNLTRIYLEVYVNEPSVCRWDRQDKDISNMQNIMNCDTNLWEMNNNQVYTCRTNITGIESRKENIYYFRCNDTQGNYNIQSYEYKIIGTQPLNILKVSPNETIFGATDTIPVFLNIQTDNGYNNGEARCYYSSTLPDSDDDYIEFLETGTNNHNQRQDLVSGTYHYYFKCVDLGGNTAYNSTRFLVESDRSSPIVVRSYKEGNDLKFITNEKSECSYSNIDCNFEINSGIQIATNDYFSHVFEWKINKILFIKCKDKYENQPLPNTCSIILKASDLS